MYRILIFCLFISNVFCQDKEYRTVVVEQGPVEGEKYWGGDFFQFYGIPYATVPKGKDRYKAPLPPTPWKDVFIADNERIACHQTYYTGEDTEEIYLAGQEDCLTLNLMVPRIANETNLVPVMVYVHSGAFSGGNGNMAKFYYLARRDIIVIGFNFRLGALGFACLGNEEIPGNAGMKDAVAALKWIKKNVQKFGGNPDKITLAGFSVGAAMAELLVLSKSTEGLVHQLVLESGSALSPYSINRDPISTATNIAISLGYNGTTLKELTEFYLNAKSDLLAAKSLNFFLTNSTFGYAPCIENVFENSQPFLTESPLDIMKRGDYPKLPVLTGFANMEGLSRTLKFDQWSDMMNANFADFLPADLVFDNEKTKNDVIKKIKEIYFKNEEVTHDNVQGYIDYFSDSMFKYSILKSAKLHAARSLPVFFYEFAFVGTMGMKHNFMDRIHGASHRDQSSYILDFYSYTSDVKDLFMRDRLTWMWTDFVKYGHPTEYESDLVNYTWLPYTEEEPNYLHIDMKTEMRKNVFSEGYKFWDAIYGKYHWMPQAPKPTKI
ncbi:esterase FE4-like [Pectinophora gossypiella]|uniref:esterase FE4-like n=1 Tax=Pectinophora gossypiella TaxID=13191 RepID=UPI00214F45B1|nr:esterase FE4-like [Pectinophora gossypiella]